MGGGGGVIVEVEIGFEMSKDKEYPFSHLLLDKDTGAFSFFVLSVESINGPRALFAPPPGGGVVV